MLLHFKKSNEILETWSPHCKNLAFKDPPSLNFHNRTDATVYKGEIECLFTGFMFATLQYLMGGQSNCLYQGVAREIEQFNTTPKAEF